MTPKQTNLAMAKLENKHIVDIKEGFASYNFQDGRGEVYGPFNTNYPEDFNAIKRVLRTLNKAESVKYWLELANTTSEDGYSVSEGTYRGVQASEWEMCETILKVKELWVDDTKTEKS